MLAISRIFASSLLLVLCAFGCRNSDKSSSSSTSSAYSCSVTQGGSLLLCTEYASLSGDALAKIQSACELKGSGYAWTASACSSTNRQTGSCTFAATDASPAEGHEYFYSSGFADEGTREQMCSAQGGTYK